MQTEDPENVTDAEGGTRRRMPRLEREAMIERQTGQLQTVISIRNYEVFQHGGAASGPSNGQAIGQQRASNGPEEENIKSIKRNYALPGLSTEGFQEWYAIYPKKKSPRAAKWAFAKVIGSGLIGLYPRPCVVCLTVCSPARISFAS